MQFLVLKDRSLRCHRHSRSIVMAGPPKEQGKATPSTAASEEKPKKKICCACPETKSARDECIALKGEEACKKLIEAHKACLRKEGFNV